MHADDDKYSVIAITGRGGSRVLEGDGGGAQSESHS